jgi:hypothetical protein
MKKYWIILIIILVLIGFIFLFSSSNPCDDITDTSQRALCYGSLDDISYCMEEPYYFDSCLDSVDPDRLASISELEEVCNAVTDTSRKEDCFVYLDENY